MKHRDKQFCLLLPRLWSSKMLLAIMFLLMPAMAQAQPKRVQDDSMRKGLYLGIIGFNSQLYEKPIGMLSQDNYTDYQSFVSSLTNDKIGTVLFYAADNALAKLETTTLPAELSSVAVISFTDGLDRGSTSWSDYATVSDYRTAVSNKIQTLQVNGTSVSAYAVGLMGGDVTDRTEFWTNLQGLSSSADNAKLVNSMSEVNSEFQNIANSLKTVTKRQNIDFIIPMGSDGERVRFTLDNVSSATSSQRFIEATFVRVSQTECYLKDIVYNGLKNTATGDVVNGELVERPNFSFHFSGIQTETGETEPIASLDNVKQWYTNSSNNWNPNVEFSRDNVKITDVSYTSAAIMLVLDCSQSLGADGLAKLKESANNFISIVASKAQNEPEPSTLKGDVNGDGQVTITDAVAIVNYTLENVPAAFDSTAADVNGDGQITITDAVSVVNATLAE